MAVRPLVLQLVSTYEILRAERWRSALLTTFSLSLSFFEAVPLHALRKARALDIGIIADSAGCQAALAEAGVRTVDHDRSDTGSRSVIGFGWRRCPSR